MAYARILAAGLAAAALGLGSVPAGAKGDVAVAEKLRQLDIMLMVTSLQCRFGADDFRADYQAFSLRHVNTLSAAASDLTQALSARHGAHGARRALDRMSVSMANSYGLGHPTLGCAQLRQVAHRLAHETGSDGLAAEADVLFADRRPESVFALAR